MRFTSSLCPDIALLFDLHLIDIDLAWMITICAGARDVVFFMHGLFDTSMGWVSNGVTGSQAFAAYDQGFDVWLGNSRANPPRSHIGMPSLPPCFRP